MKICVDVHWSIYSMVSVQTENIEAIIVVKALILDWLAWFLWECVTVNKK